MSMTALLHICNAVELLHCNYNCYITHLEVDQSLLILYRNP